MSGSVGSIGSASLETEEDAFSLSSLLSDGKQASQQQQQMMASPSKKAFFRRLQRPAKPLKRAHYVQTNGRDALEMEIINAGNKPDLNFIMKLGMHLIQGNFNWSATRGGTMLLEWAHLRGIDFTAKEERCVAKAHLDIYMGAGIYGEPYHLQRAKHLYLKLIDSCEQKKEGYRLVPEKMLIVKKELLWVLQYLGDGEQGQQTGMEALELIHELNDTGASAVNMQAGSLCKDMEDYDSAANFFFEVINSDAMPGTLSRTEMLFIISRNLNQLEFEKAKRDGRVYVDDYRMIHLQMIQDGIIPSDTSYEAWIGNWDTWANIASKCEALRMSTIAADLYGQGLIFDHRQYRNPRCWWILGKTFHRCGRFLDARSSLTQSISIDNTNDQYNRAMRCWSEGSSTFEEAIHTWYVSQIIELLPHNHDLEVPAVGKLRALVEIARIRHAEQKRKESELERLRLAQEARERAMAEGLMAISATNTKRERPKKDRSKQNPRVLWKTPEPIVYPSKLTPTECNAICKEVDGEFEYFPGTDDNPLPAGEHKLEVEFIPRNTNKFNVMDLTVIIVIRKAIPVVKWRNPSAYYVGTKLNHTDHLNADLQVHSRLGDGDDDGNNDKKSKKGKSKKKGGFNFGDDGIGNAEQLVDPPTGTFYYYLEELSVELPEEEQDVRLFNDDYYLNLAKIEKGEDEIEKSIPWQRVDTETSLPVGKHRLMTLFVPKDRRNYKVVRKFVDVTVMPKVVPAIIWQPPPAPLTYPAVLSKFELNARMKDRKVKGKFVYYHMMNDEDVETEEYKEEIEEHRRQIAERKTEAIEREDMFSNDVNWEYIIVEEVDLESLVTADDSASLGLSTKETGKDHAPISGGGKSKKEKEREKRDKKRTDKEKKKKERQQARNRGKGGRASPSPSQSGRESPVSLDGTEISMLSGDSKMKGVKELRRRELARKHDHTSDMEDDFLKDVRLRRRRMHTGYVLPAGMCKLQCIFHPSDNVMYDENMQFIYIKVNPAPLEILWGTLPETPPGGAGPVLSSLPELYDTELFNLEKHLNARLSTNLDGDGKGVFTYTVESVSIVQKEGEEESEVRHWLGLDEHLEKQQKLMEEQQAGEDGDKDDKGDGKDGKDGKDDKDGKNDDTDEEAVRVDGDRVTTPTAPYLPRDNTRGIIHDDARHRPKHPTGLTPTSLGSLPKGHHTLHVHYAPFNARNHTTCEARVAVTVRNRPRIMWREDYIDEIRSGVALSEDNLDATVTEVGTISYYPPLGEYLEVGVYQLKATFVPFDSTLHDITHHSVPLTVVRKLIPKCKWQIPVLVYGESVNMDNIYTASSLVPGSFKYSMSLGKLLDAGSYSIVAAFSPEDTITYANNTLVEQLVVEKLETMIEFQPRELDQTMYLQYGEPLEDEHFCAHVFFPEEENLPHLFGNISYSHEEGDYLPVGEHVLTAYFQPLPPYDKNYTACTTSTIVYVHKFTPLLQWITPNPVVFGTGSLTSAILNAQLKYDVILTRKEMAARGEQLEQEREIEAEMEREKEETAGMYIKQPDGMHYQDAYPGGNGVLDVPSFTDLETDGATFYNDQGSYYTNVNDMNGGGVNAVQSLSGGPHIQDMGGSMGELQIGMPSIATAAGTGSLASPGGFGLAGPLTVNTFPSRLEESGLIGTGEGQVGGQPMPGSPQELAVPGTYNFNLSQVSLGIYTDYGSTIQGMDSVDTPGADGSGPDEGGDDGVLETKEGEHSDGSYIHTDQGSTSNGSKGGKGTYLQGSSNGNVDSNGVLHPLATDNTLADSLTMTAFEGGEGDGSLTMYTKFEGGSLEGTLEGNETLGGPGLWGGMDMSLEGGVSTYHTHAGGGNLDEGESTADITGAGGGLEGETSQQRARAARLFLDTRPYLSVLPDAPQSQRPKGAIRLKLGKQAPNDLFHKETEVQQVGAGELVEVITKEQGVRIKGHFRYTPDIGAVLPHAGVFTLRAIFVPQDEENVGTADITVTLTVLRARPVVRWEQPRPMFSGTALSRLELNATVHCPGLREQDGQLEYFPNRGEHLPVGLHVLRCRYVPFKFATNNFDCQHSWAEVPLLVKPKPFNAAYLDTLATEGGKESVKRMLTKNVTDGSTSWATGATLPTLYDETRAKTAASAMRIRTGDGVLKRMASRAAEGGARFSRKGKKKEKESKVIGSNSSTQRSTTAPASTSRPPQGSGYGQKEKQDLHQTAVEAYSIEHETRVSPRTKKDMNQLRENIVEASLQREAVNRAHGHVRDQSERYEDPYENSISSSILDGSDGIMDPSVEHVSAGEPHVEPYFEIRSALGMYGPNASHEEEKEEVEKGNTIVQLDAFGRELIMQKDDLEEYVGNDRQYRGTYTNMAAEKNFSGGIPIPAEASGSHSGAGKGGASRQHTPSSDYIYNEYDDEGGREDKAGEYLLKEIDLSQYSIGSGPDRDRIFRSKEDTMDAYTRFRYKPTPEEAHNEVRLDQLARAVESRDEGRGAQPGRVGRDQNLFDDFYNNPRGSVDTSNSITFADLPEGASRSMFPSRSPSPDDREEGLPGVAGPAGMGHLGGEHFYSTGTPLEHQSYQRAMTAPGKESRGVAAPSTTAGYSKRKLKSKQRASTSYHSSSRLSSTGKRNNDDNLLYKKEKDTKHTLAGKPIFHTGAGNTGKHTAKSDMDSKRKNMPQTKPFRWNYFVDVRNVFENDNKATVAGEKQKGEKRDMREDKFLPLAAKARHSREGVDAEVEEWKARRQLMRLERQINSLRRDAFGIAKMVAYTEQLRNTTGGGGGGGGGGGNNGTRGSMSPPRDRPNTTDGSRIVNPQHDYGSLFMQDTSSYGNLPGAMFGPGGAVGPYGELQGDEDDEEMNVQKSTVQGLNRIPGIGTGAANRIISSFELENPYYEITAGPEARTGKWSSAPTGAYANATMASDRLTDTNTRKKERSKKPKRAKGTGTGSVSGGSSALLSPIKKAKNKTAAGNAVQLIRSNEGTKRPQTSA